MTADDIIQFGLCCIGAMIFYWLWSHDILSTDIIWKILTAEI